MQKDALLRLKHVSKSYEVNKKLLPILNNVIFSIDQGELVLIMGPSGSGKSTLLNMMGLLDTPSSGEIHLSSQLMNPLIESERSRIRANTIGFVFQEFHLFPNLSVLENVMVPLLLKKKMSVKERTKRARDLLDLVGMSHRIRAMPSTLSGGEKQRVSIARALAVNPQLLLADEPTGNVDEENELHLIGVFQKLAQSGVSVVVVSHNGLYKEYVDRFYTLRKGTLVEEEVSTYEAQ